MHNIRYLRVILTRRCNLDCFYCHHEGNVDAGGSDIDYDFLCLAIRMLIGCGIKKVKFLGGEPTLYRHLSEIVRFVRALDSQTDISMVSNGIVNEDVLGEVVEAGLQRVNISLHGLNCHTFRRLTRGSEQQLERILQTIAILKKKGVLGKINYLLLKGENEDEFLDVLRYVHEEDLVIDVLNYLSDKEPDIFRYYFTFTQIVSMISDRYPIARREPHANRYSIDSERLYLSGGGTVNLKVNQLNEIDFLKSCDACDKSMFCKEGISAIRLTNTGWLKPCLFRDDNGLDLRRLIGEIGADAASERLRDYLENL